jgi:hypothetical protein
MCGMLGYIYIYDVVWCIFGQYKNYFYFIQVALVTKVLFQ